MCRMMAVEVDHSFEKIAFFKTRAADGDIDHISRIFDTKEEAAFAEAAPAVGTREFV
jgi:hypothetical protein